MMDHPVGSEAECDVYKMITVEDVDYERKVRTCLPTAVFVVTQTRSHATVLTTSEYGIPALKRST